MSQQQEQDSFLLVDHPSRQLPQDSFLLIDHPSRQPSITRVRSMGLDKSIIENSIDTSIVSDFHTYSLYNSCNNFLCFSKNARSKHHDPCLLDLVDNKLIPLPKSPVEFAERFCTFYGVGYDSRIGKYKTVRIVVKALPEGVHNFIHAVEVNVLGEDQWKTVKSRKGKPSGSILGKPISIKNAIVWADFPQNNVAYSSQRLVHVFNLGEEEFTEVRLPRGLKIGHLVGINGQLCAVDLSSNSSIQISVLPDVEGQWVNFCTIKMCAPRGENNHRLTRVIGGFENGKLLLESFLAYFTYDPITEELEYLHLPLETSLKTEVHCYNIVELEYLPVEEEEHGWGWGYGRHG